MIRRHRDFITFAFLLVILASVLALLVMLLSYNLTSLRDGKHSLYIADSTPQAVEKALAQAGYELTDWDRQVLAYASLPKRGWYRIRPDRYKRIDFLQNLHRYRTDRVQTIHIEAARTLPEIMQRLADAMKLDSELLINYYKIHAPYPEGAILAGDYLVAKGVRERVLVHYLLNRSQEQMHQILVDETDRYHTPEERRRLLIVASILHRETYYPDEMPKIAAVVYNRLARGMRLQMDGTLNYGPYAHTIVTPERIREDSSRYNTYKRPGLPPHPLGSVSATALRAAVSPEKSNDLYFMLDLEGGHRFAATYAEHLRNIAAYKAQKNARDKAWRINARSSREPHGATQTAN
jgi:UPF0755 protein